MATSTVDPNSSISSSPRANSAKPIPNSLLSLSSEQLQQRIADTSSELKTTRSKLKDSQLTLEEKRGLKDQMSRLEHSASQLERALVVVRRESMYIAWASLAVFVLLFLIYTAFSSFGATAPYLLRVFPPQQKGDELHFDRIAAESAERVEAGMTAGAEAIAQPHERGEFKWKRDREMAL